ncbi:MAG: tRNA epoxyqueuosine(34) reductase QueG [Snowella sp.]|nr:tRNA epoxyqueuosine(34) reductase QueG [Snowella sp.]
MTITSDQVKQKAIELGFHLVGIADVDQEFPDQALERLKAWLTMSYQAEMQWMANPKRFDIRACFPDVQSVISVAINYYTPHQRAEGKEYAKISRYGWGRDYHKVMTRRLKALSHWLEDQDKTIKTRYYADTGPIQDKVWAQRSGLGWIAKNGNVITRNYGSWVFLGEVLINIPLTPDRPHTEHCGTCTRCLDACPTGAITQPFVINSDRCIAYHTIENRSDTLPDDIKPHLDGWVAGCDICQDVCPWNQRFAKETDIPDFQPYPENINPKLKDLAEISDQEWDQRFTASALRRIKTAMLRRNARASLE